MPSESLILYLTSGSLFKLASQRNNVVKLVCVCVCVCVSFLQMQIVVLLLGHYCEIYARPDKFQFHLNESVMLVSSAECAERKQDFLAHP